MCWTKSPGLLQRILEFEIEYRELQVMSLFSAMH